MATFDRFSVFRFDEVVGTNVIDYYQAWQYTDDGEETRDKIIKAISGAYKIGSSPTLKIYGAGSSEQIAVSGIEAGTGEKVSIPGATSVSNPVKMERTQVNVPNVAVWTIRVAGTWNQATSTSRDRVDEIVVERAVQGVRR